MGKIVQKFCSDGCRYHYHNSLRKEERAFFKETVLLLRKFSHREDPLSESLSKGGCHETK